MDFGRVITLYKDPILSVIISTHQYKQSSFHKSIGKCLGGDTEKWTVPAGYTHHKEGDGHHITFVPIVLHIEFEFFKDVGVLISEKALKWHIMAF